MSSEMRVTRAGRGPGVLLRSLSPCALSLLLVLLPAPARADGPAANRVVAEVLGGVLGGAVGVSAAVGLTIAACNDDALGCFLLALGAGGAAAVFAIPGGVTIAGNLMDGHGSYGWSVVGALGGALLTGLFVAAVDDIDVDSPLLWVVAVGLLVAGPVVGYELSHSANTPRETTTAQPLVLGLGFAF